MNIDGFTTPLEVTDSFPLNARERFTRVFVWTFGVLVLVYLLMFAVLPIDFQIASELSPNGRLRADYTYRPSGILELFIRPESASHLRLTISDEASGHALSTFAAEGDTVTVDEAKKLLGHHIPWTTQL